VQKEEDHEKDEITTTVRATNDWYKVKKDKSEMIGENRRMRVFFEQSASSRQFRIDKVMLCVCLNAYEHKTVVKLGIRCYGLPTGFFCGIPCWQGQCRNEISSWWWWCLLERGR
jgi:hypothetical protein